MTPVWSELFDEIARWRDAGRTVDFWWRDDDACHADPALDRLVELSASTQVPLALAVVAHGVEAPVLQQDARWVRILQHGTDHVRRNGVDEKKTEFPASEPVADALQRLRLARARIAGPLTLPVLVPPWNRIGSVALLEQLAGAGYRGLSRFGPRKAGSPIPGLVQVNTHVDIIDWHGSRGFVGEEPALRAATAHLQARREGRADAGEPTGFLSHHLVHDEASWRFLSQLFERTRDHDAVVWLGPQAVFGCGRDEAA